MFRLITGLAARFLPAALLVLLLLAREWHGTNTPLTLIYEQQDPIGRNFRTQVISAEGGESAPLLLDGRNVEAADCSPDGNWLAFMQLQRVLTVLNRDGLAYTRDLGDVYVDVSIANDGSVTARDIDSRYWQIGETDMTPLELPHSREARYGPGRVAADGLSLTISELANLIVAAPDGDVLRIVPDVGKAEWLGDEQTAVLLDPFQIVRRSPREYEQYLLDARRGVTARLNAPTRFVVYAPDGTQAVVGTPIESLEGEPLALIDPFENRVLRVLAADAGWIYTPLCFLTFAPGEVERR